MGSHSQITQLILLTTLIKGVYFWVCVYVIRHFQQRCHQPDIVANPARGKLRSVVVSEDQDYYALFTLLLVYQLHLFLFRSPEERCEWSPLLFVVRLRVARPE